jgi:sirohydrochlorin cobaltochelatase
MPDYRDAALVIAGHGSTLNADSSTPIYRHADAIRAKGLFAEVRECFWKEEPNFRWVLSQVSSPRVYVVPDFISSGYFTEEVIPRELGLRGPITQRDGKEIRYCDPVGLHPTMTEALLKRAEQVIRDSGAVVGPTPADTAVLVIGHGTGLNDNSVKIVQDQARRIAATGLFGECLAVFMEQEPFVKDWQTLTSRPDVIALPFFIADGLHSYEDIPVLLGMTRNVREEGFRNPHRLEGRRLWYGSAVGTDPAIAEIVLAQVEKFDADHGTT